MAAEAAGGRLMPHRLKLMGPIGESLWFESIRAADVAEFLGSLPNDGETLYVGPVLTPGGATNHGMAIRQLLEDETAKRPVVFQVYGEAASTGAHIVIGTRGARVEMARDADLMIHSPWYDIGPASSGEHKAHAEHLAILAGSIADSVAERAPTVDRDELAAQLAERSPLYRITVPAAQAVELGLADAIIGEPDPELAAEAAEAGAALASSQETTEQEGASMATAQLPLRQTAPTPQSGVPAQQPEPSPPPTPAPATPQPAPQAATSAEDMTLFERFMAWKNGPAAKPEPQPAASAAVPQAAPFAPVVPQMQAASSIDAGSLAIMNVSAETYAAARIGAMQLPPQMQAHARQLGPLKLAEMQAAVNLQVAQGTGDAQHVAVAQQAHALAAANLTTFERVLTASAETIAAASAPLTTANAASPTAVAVDGEGEGAAQLAATHAKILLERGLVTPESLAKSAKKYPALAAMAAVAKHEEAA